MVPKLLNAQRAASIALKTFHPGDTQLKKQRREAPREEDEATQPLPNKKEKKKKRADSGSAPDEGTPCGGMWSLLKVLWTCALAVWIPTPWQVTMVWAFFVCYAPDPLIATLPSAAVSSCML